MRLLLAIAAGVDLLSAIFVLVGITSYSWFNVDYTTTDPIYYNVTVDIASTFTIFGVVKYTLTVDGNATQLILDHWQVKTDCIGDCTGTTTNANLACSQLSAIRGDGKEDETTQDFRSWYYGAACTYPKPTIAMITLCLIVLAFGVPFTGMSAFDLCKPIIPLVLNAVSWFWLFLAMCIYGGGVAAKARSADWTNDNAMVLIKGITLFPDPNGASFGLGFAYALPCTAMFLMLGVVGLVAFEWRKDPTAGGISTKGTEMQRV